MQPNRQDQSGINGASGDERQEYLAGELSAVETYELALKRMPHGGLRHALLTILGSHTRWTG
jgi:hypothetical protein